MFSPKPNEHLISFGNAKVKSIKSFKSLHFNTKTTLSISSKLDETLKNPENVVSKKEKKFLEESIEKCNRIITVLERKQMKCAFFGRTSNGKSTVINAMLGNKILPCGIGHTTNCFVQIQGTNKKQGYITSHESGDGNSIDTLPVHSLSELGHAFSRQKLSNDAIIYLYWPEKDCSILKSDVSILDSPGVDIDPDLDYWIDKHCLDADVFVLVSNSESTLSNTEKNFFMKVRNKISNPHIYILNNRWDLCDLEENDEKIFKEMKKQHKKRCIDFLSKELGVCSETEAQNYVFFVSGKDMLDIRSQQVKPTEPLDDRKAERLKSFKEFEESLEKNLCNQALKTKFSSHTSQGLEISTKVREIIESLHQNVTKHIRKITEEKFEELRQMKSIKTNITTMNSLVTKEMSRVLDTVTIKLTSHFQEQIRQLNIIIRDFHGDFDSDSTRLLIYKTELNNYLEHQLNSRLTNVSTAVVQGEMKLFKSFIIKKYSSLIEEDLSNHPVSLDIMLSRDSQTNSETTDDNDNTAEKSQQMHIKTKQNQPTKSESTFNNLQQPDYVNIPCNTLLSTFREDLEFRWPLNPSRIISSLLHLNVGPLRNTTPQVPHSTNTVTHLASLTPFLEQYVPSSVIRYQNTIRSSLQSGSVGTLMSELIDFIVNPEFFGFLALSVMIRKGTGIRWLFCTSTSYLMLYVVERYQWSGSTQEKIFKKQYIKYATIQLSNFSNICAKNHSLMLKQEMLMIDRSLQKVVDQKLECLDGKLKKSSAQVKVLNDCSQNLENLKTTTKEIIGEFEEFRQNYLK